MIGLIGGEVITGVAIIIMDIMVGIIDIIFILIGDGIHPIRIIKDIIIIGIIIHQDITLESIQESYPIIKVRELILV
jgi:hypothetical protein